MNMQTFAQILLVLSLTTLARADTSPRAPTSTQPAYPRTISADLLQIKGPLNTMFKTCVGAGRANEGLRADWQRQLTLLHNACGFTYIRMHGIFTDDMGVYRDDKTSPAYNWQYVDELYDFLQSIHMKPFVELGFCPNALASGPQTIFWWKGNITQPKDPKKWADLITAFVTHLQERYGHDEIKTWYFEVWNEPNLKGFFFTGTQQDYFNLYANTARAIKSVSPDYRVGGPATAGCAWVPEFISFCAKNNAPVDFISSHDYCVQAGFLDEHGNAGTIFSQDPAGIYGNIRRLRKQIHDSPIPNLQLHMTEWSASYTPADPIHDSYHSAAFILDKIKNTATAADSMSYWTFTDIFEESGPRFTPFHGGFGLINYEDIPKPAFFAYKFLSQLGPTELQNTDPASFVCADPAGNAQVLAWDFTITNPAKTMNNQQYYIKDLPPNPARNLTLHLTHLPDAQYQLDIYQVGYRANDAYDLYKDMHSPNQLTRTQVAELKAATTGAPILEKTIHIQNNTFDHTLPMRQNDVFLLTLKKQ